MIEVQYTKDSLVRLLSDQHVDRLAHWCNCFHEPDTDMYRNLNRMTGGLVQNVDVLESDKGEINKLGTYSELVSDLFNQHVIIYNLYVSYTLKNDQYNTVHSLSVFSGLVSIIGQMESGETLVIPDLNDHDELVTILDTITSDYEQELPDVTVVVLT